jgi:hypothetical protein
VGVVSDVAVLAAVGQRMAQNKGIAAKTFDALAKANVNIIAMAQGSSEYNITILVAQADVTRGLRAVHSRFFMSTTTLNVAVIGPGEVGGTLLDQLAQQRQLLVERYKLDVRVLAIASSSSALLSQTGARQCPRSAHFSSATKAHSASSSPQVCQVCQHCLPNCEPTISRLASRKSRTRSMPECAGIDLATWRKQWVDVRDDGITSTPLDHIADHLVGSSLPNTVIIDCTTAEAPAARYLDWMRRGIHIVTPNKRLGSGPLARYDRVRQFARSSYTHWYYEVPPQHLSSAFLVALACLPCAAPAIPQRWRLAWPLPVCLCTCTSPTPQT